jgi:tetratricopeptide (TPR) repeat protein
LRILGRLTEAVEPTQAALDMAVTLADWTNAAGAASNLSQLQLLLGEVAVALEEARTCMLHADRSELAISKIISRQSLARALHQAGRSTEAEAGFREAEAIQTQIEPHQPYLYALMGFRYCELLLAEAERAAWASSLGLVPLTELGCDSRAKAALESCTAVSQRTAQTLPISERNRWLYNIALDHLTLGRAALYASILDPQNRQLPLPSSHIGSVVDDLLQAGQYEFIGLGLLSRAWLRSLTGVLTGADSAQSDLDDAWEIAERGPMPLFLADIHLYRARLFFREKNYPEKWQSPQHDLAEARRLIEKHGYGRRKEELQDAEGAILPKPASDHR